VLSVPDHVHKDHIYQSVYGKGTCTCGAVISWECYTEKKNPTLYFQNENGKNFSWKVAAAF